ncbi:DUF4215 domain-containing protein [Nannocystis sp.]|uniref:DUF4215 domain-containing protein n=1 Tax=Nannocystis sp. TaxID=1962667 RepID=UPI0025D8C949|nr:DUF4215 domain-containing protein [Nannocystis sp.]MBK7824371.1 DUF4215 domain-containing protein [Nannocystis sp.]
MSLARLLAPGVPMSPLARLLLLAPLPLLVACKPNCADNEVANKHGYDCTPFGEASTTSDASTSDASTSSTSDSSSSTSEPSSTTSTPPCDDDPACGPDESVATCPAQCSECGDGMVTADEPCDNGNDNQTYWPAEPPDGACSETCTTTLEWCGDNKKNGTEPCDNGVNTDAPYLASPPPGACAPACTAVEFCGDNKQNGPEPCDTAAQTATCELDCRVPTCGDGTLNTPAGELCDDNNTDDGDGCSADCKSLERLVFVTSAPFKGDLGGSQGNPDTLTGLALADFRCQALAGKAGLPGTYKAWLSTDTESPSTRFDTTFTGLYRLPSQGFPVIAEGWTALTSGTLDHAINADETGTLTEENVFTNTLPDATSASALDCNHWTAKDNPMTTSVGYSAASDNTWTNLGSNQFCSGVNRLYCFQDL